MPISEYEKSCNILNIVVDDENDITEAMLRKSYHRCCLMYHPDKNNEVTSC
jgi:DnaJ-class molecular chaperone